MEQPRGGPLKLMQVQNPFINSGTLRILCIRIQKKIISLTGHPQSRPEFLVTPKFGVLLRIWSNWEKHSEFTPKFGAPRLGHHFCSLNGWKIFSRSLDMTKSRCLQKTLSARTNFLQIVVQNYKIQPSIFRLKLETKIHNFKCWN